MKVLLSLLLVFTGSICFANNTYRSRCSSCHGSKGQGVPGYAPKLAGQFSFYLTNQINDIKSGDRNNGRSSIMRPIFNSLSNNEIEAISDWLSKQK